MGHGDNGRTRQKALVVVPHIGTVTELGVNHRDLLVACTQIWVEGMHLGLAKMPGNCQMLIGRHVRYMQH